MKSMIRLAMALVFVVLIAAPAIAAEDTYRGSLMCAMCMLKKADAHQCQDVLVVTEASGAQTEYYVTKNEVAQKAGEACTQEIRATITGTVSQKDGKTWLTPSKIEKH
jgi:hypothetical protein